MKQIIVNSNPSLVLLVVRRSALNEAASVEEYPVVAWGLEEGSPPEAVTVCGSAVELSDTHTAMLVYDKVREVGYINGGGELSRKEAVMELVNLIDSRRG